MCGSGCRKKRKLTDDEWQLVLDNQKLVRHIVYKLVNKGTLKLGDEDDDVQDGLFGLMQAAQKFDPERGYSFTTFATACIRNELLVRRQWRTRQRRTGERVSMDEGPLHDRAYAELIPSDDDVERDAIDDLPKRVVRRLRAEGREKQARIVELYAIGGLTLEETAAELGVSKQAISQQMKRLRQTVAEERVDDD